MFNEITPLISIIIPCFNVESCINKIFESLDAQTLKDYEVVFINDGSIDKTEEMIIEYGKNDLRVKLISLPTNIGAGNARNLGLQNALGNYIIFLDADDSFDKDLLQELFAAAEKNSADIILFKTKCYDYKEQKLSDTDVKWLWTGEYPLDTVFGQEVVEDNLFTFCRGALWNKLFKKELIKDNGLFFINLPRHNDSYFVYTAYSVAKTFYIIDKRLLTYSVNRNGSISSTIEEDSKYKDINIEALYAFLRNRNLYEKYKNALREYDLIG